MSSPTSFSLVRKVKQTNRNKKNPLANNFTEQQTKIALKYFRKCKLREDPKVEAS